MAKAKAAKCHLLRLAVPAWAHKKTLAIKIKEIPSAAKNFLQPPLDQLLALIRSHLQGQSHVDTFDMLSGSILHSSAAALHDADMEEAYQTAPPTPKRIQDDAAIPSCTAQQNAATAAPPTCAATHVIASDDDLNEVPWREPFDYEGNGGMDRNEDADNETPVVTKRISSKRSDPSRTKPPRSRSRSPQSHDDDSNDSEPGLLQNTTRKSYEKRVISSGESRLTATSDMLS